MAWLLRTGNVCGSLLIASCTYVHVTSPPSLDKKPETTETPIQYTLHTQFRTASPADRQNAFRIAVEDAIREMGFRVVNIDKGNPVSDGARSEAPLRLDIDVTEQDWAHTAPQEWLTGLSLGLIPSWAKRDELLIQYSLSDGNSLKREFAYTVSSYWINHLLLFPIALFQLEDSDYQRQARQLNAVTKYFLQPSNQALEQTR